MSYEVYKNSTCDGCEAKDCTTYGLGGPDSYDDDVMAYCEVCIRKSECDLYLRHVVLQNLPDVPVVDEARVLVSEFKAEEPSTHTVEKLVKLLAGVVEELDAERRAALNYQPSSLGIPDRTKPSV